MGNCGSKNDVKKKSIPLSNITNTLHNIAKDENIHNAFSELNKLTALNNAIYWLEKYLENHNDAKICKIKNSLEISVDTINDAFIELSNIIAECY